MSSTKYEKMKEIKDEVLALTASPLYSYRTQNSFLPVIGEGSHDAAIVFIGEAPGKNEAKTGRPFCGRAGKVLDELLATISLPRNDIYITNIVKDRPPENRDPTPEEIQVYGPFLDRQIEIIKPKVLATLGRYSMAYIMGKVGLIDVLRPISAMHGNTFLGEFNSKPITVVPLYHPAVAIYNVHSKQELIDDFQILKQFL